MKKFLPWETLTTVDSLRDRLMQVSGNNPQEAGRLFERFVKAFLRTHNYYGRKFVNVWLWSEYPNRKGRIDTGIDIVAEDEEGDKWAIQSKFYEKGKITHEDVSKFIASAVVPDEFEFRMLVYTGELTEEAEKTLENNRVYVVDLDKEEIDWNKIDWSRPEQVIYQKKEIRPYQQEAIDSVVRGFQEMDRGKLIMPPGSGKTFVALKIAERIAGVGDMYCF